MKFIKYSLAALLAALMIAAVTAHIKREALALSIANSILSGSDFVVTDLAIDRLNTHELHFSRLDLQQSGGARIELRDLQLPLALPDTTISSVSIGSVEYLPAAEQGEPTSLTDLLDLALNLPDAFGDISVYASQVTLPDWPVFDELDWHSFERGQLLTLTVESMDIELEGKMLDAGHYSVTMAASRATVEPDITLELQLERLAKGYVANGSTMLELDATLELLRELNFIADDALVVAGRLNGPARLDIETDDAAEVRALVTLARDAETAISYASADGLRLQTAGAEVYELATTYPALTWRVTAGSLSAAAATDSIDNIELQLASVVCGLGLQCQLALDASMPAVTLDGTSANDVSVTGQLTADFADTLRVTLEAASLSAKTLAGESWSIASLQLVKQQDLLIRFGEAGLEASGKSLQLQLQDLRVGTDIVATLPLTLRDFSLASDGLRTAGGFDIAASGASLTYGASSVVVPRASGSFKLFADQDDALAGEVHATLGSSGQSLQGALNITLDPGRTTVQIASASLDFDKSALSKRLRRWPHAWDLVAGRVLVQGQFEIGDGSALTGTAEVRLADVGGHYNDIAATGISGTLPIRIEATNSIQVGPETLQIELIDVGVPIEKLRASVAFDSSRSIARIEALGFSLLGGTVAAAPFNYRLQDASANLNVSLHAIQLPLMAQLADFEDIEVSGTVSGELPVEIEGTNVRIVGGKLASDAPGGVIRYSPGATSTDTSALGLATKALSNLHYESLTSDVTYTRAGDLVLKMRLKGTNPEYDPLQPVILNLGVENNIPQLLRSLQASRDIEDIIEQRH